ncbi:hypothetical protein QBC42DRAFT_279563 [Cladorrhinum samala]|uniref:WKF domain-containing protein n=1 Tax=Cladorrhinum samala TaxID=585594 RepID=A0AAV9H9G3_9PEZI|nr:hypothetical protein QBC42DRAFT_279563 [Cladorrhinum samala]
MSARVPAWKRLGLKLKGASDDGPASSSPAPSIVPNNHVAQQSRAVNGASPASALKRKLPYNTNNYNNSNNPYPQTPNKRQRSDQQTPNSLKKSVSFSADTKAASTTEQVPKKKAKKPKKPKKEPSQKPETDLSPSLTYLRQWSSSRETWKFNKNHQTLLIKYLFPAEASPQIPSEDVPIFYRYIRDLKGGVRSRLRESAIDLIKRDMDQGAGGFGPAAKDKEAKQAEYEEVIARFLSDLTNDNGKRPLDEKEYVIRAADPAVKARLLKRIRAEMVKVELGSESESEGTATTDTATDTATDTTELSGAASSSATVQQEAPAPAPRRTDGSQQPTKRRRLRNVRTDISSDESSSESESDSDSSDDDESEDEEAGKAPPGGNQDETSDSSTSSESDSDSDSESDSDSGAEGGAEEAAEETSSSSSSSSSSGESDSE